MFNFIFNLFSYFVSASCVLLPVSCVLCPASCVLCPAHDARNSRSKLASRQKAPSNQPFPDHDARNSRSKPASRQKAPSNNHFQRTTQRNPAKNLRRDRRRRPITVSCARRKEFPPKTCVATEGGVASKGGRRHGIRQHGIIFTVQRYGEYSMQIRIFFPIIRIFIQNAMHIS